MPQPASAGFFSTAPKRISHGLLTERKPSANLLPVGPIAGRSANSRSSRVNPYCVTIQGQILQIPARHMEPIAAYLADGTPPPTFIAAIICNDLRDAVCLANADQIRNLPAYVNFFHHEAPALCWGSRTRMDAWVGIGGQQGIDANVRKVAA